MAPEPTVVVSKKQRKKKKKNSSGQKDANEQIAENQAEGASTSNNVAEKSIVQTQLPMENINEKAKPLGLGEGARCYGQMSI